jgi:hypothetical protein
MSAPAATPTPVITISTERLVVYLKWCRAAVWALCGGGMWMGYLVSQASVLRSAKFTLLGGIAGWPEVWGYTLMTLGILSLGGRLIGPRALWAGLVRIDGNAVAAVAMLGMSFWYAVFASSLILGTAEYGYAPYLTLAALHTVFAILVYRTAGFRFTPRVACG